MMNADKSADRGKLIVLSGPAGSGKSTVLKELFKLSDYKYSISATTREPRSGEAEGEDYHFMPVEQFFEKVSDGEMLEYVEYAGNYYGTLRGPIEKMIGEGHNVILEIEVEGALNVKEKYPGTLLIFLATPTYSEEKIRLKKRGTETEKSINERLGRAKRELESMHKYDYLVLNESDAQKKAAHRINCIVEAEKCRVSPEKAVKFVESYF